jgi:hypothetical protein
MKTLSLSLALLLYAASTAFSQQVLDLPEDGGLWHTTLILPDDSTNNPRSARLLAHFASTPRLQTLASQTSLHRYTPSDPLFSARYAPYFGGVFPALLIQKADGTVVYKVSGDAIPPSGEQLADEIAQAIDQCCPLRPRPQPSPKPSVPQVTPNVSPKFPEVHIDLIPDLRPQNDPEPKQPKNDPAKAPPFAPVSPLILLAPILAGALGLRRQPRSIL